MDETRRVLLADAFGTEPMGGCRVAVAVDEGELSPDDLASELGTPTAVLDAGGDRLRVVGDAVETALIGTYGGLAAVGGIDTGERAVQVEEGTRTVQVEEEATWVEATIPTWEATEPEETGIDAEERLDFSVGSAAGRTVVGAGYLSALETPPAAGVVAFTFETLAPDAHVHVRTGDGPAGAADCAAVVAALEANDAFDGEFPERVRCETGYLEGRPGEVWVDPAGRVGGPVAVSLTGELRVSGEGEDDDIIVA